MSARFGRGARPIPGLLLLVPLAPLAAAEVYLPPDAVTVLEQSIAAHSSGPAKLRLVYRGTGVFPDQSVRPDAPFRKHPWDVSLAIDESSGALAFDTKVSIDGDFTFRTRYGFSGGKGFSTTYTGEYEDLTAYPAVADAFVPHLLLRNVLDTARVATLERDGPYDRLTYAAESGTRSTLLFDRKTHLLAAVRRPPKPTVFGDQERETIYRSYRKVGNAVVPGRVTMRLTSPVQGTADVERRLVEASVSGPRPSELAPPRGAAKRAPPARELATETLGRDVYLLRNAGTEGQFSYNVLVVLFDDHVLIADASLNDATSHKVIEAIASLAVGKPIRTLVQSHHHGDHIGGIRTYIANGTTIIAPAGTQRLFERIAAAHSAIEPDALARSPRPALVEEVKGERIIRDGRNEIRLYDLPTEHSAHMLVVYLPEQRVLYQGDLISAGEIPLNATSRRFLAWLRERHLPVTSIAGVHGRTVTGAELETLLREERLTGLAGRGSPSAEAQIR